MGNAGNTPWRLYKHFNHEGGIANPELFIGWGISKGHHRAPRPHYRHPPDCLQLAGLEKAANFLFPDESLLNSFQNSSRSLL